VEEARLEEVRLEVVLENLFVDKIVVVAVVEEGKDVHVRNYLG
jgi:hypothetical protein